MRYNSETLAGVHLAGCVVYWSGPVVRVRVTWYACAHSNNNNVVHHIIQQLQETLLRTLLFDQSLLSAPLKRNLLISTGTAYFFRQNRELIFMCHLARHKQSSGCHIGFIHQSESPDFTFL